MTRRNKCILVIDDEELVRQTLESILREAGFDVATAANGEEGLKFLGDHAVDLVVTDILMPQKEGIETIVQMRKFHPHLGVVAISGGGRTRNLEPLKFARQLGADATIPKPFEPEDLVNAVRSVSDSRATLAP